MKKYEYEKYEFYIDKTEEHQQVQVYHSIPNTIELLTRTKYVKN